MPLIQHFCVTHVTSPNMEVQLQVPRACHLPNCQSMIFWSTLGELPWHYWTQWNKKTHWLNKARISLVCLSKLFSQLNIRSRAYANYLFPLARLWRKRQLPAGQFITAVSGMVWTTSLRKIMISLSLIHTYHPVLYELYHLSRWQRGQAEGWQPQEGRSKSRRVAPGWGGGPGDLLDVWLHHGPTDGFVSQSSH